MGQPYGTVMVAQLDGAIEDVEAALARWVEERHVPGFRHEDIMLCDDGRTVVMAVRFDSEDEYRALADDPEQSRWYAEVMAPMLVGEPQWFDGTWRVMLDA